MAKKVLGQVKPGAGVLTTLYTVPAAKETVISSYVACNLGAEADIRVAVRPAGEAIEDKHFIVFDAVITANDSIVLVHGVTLSATDVVSVRSDTGEVSFSIFGDES